MAYEAFYSVRSSEIGSDYRLTKTGAAFFLQECAAEYFTSKGLAGYDMARHSLTWLIRAASKLVFLGKCLSGESA